MPDLGNRVLDIASDVIELENAGEAQSAQIAALTDERNVAQAAVNTAEARLAEYQAGAVADGQRITELEDRLTDALNALTAARVAVDELHTVITAKSAEIARLEAVIAQLEAGEDTDPVQVGMVTGINYRSPAQTPHPYAAFRVYRYSKLLDTALVHDAVKVVALTDDARAGGTSGATGAARLRTALGSLYPNPGGAPTGIQVHVANDNEEDRDFTGTMTAARIATYQAKRAVIDDFPEASLWADLTVSNILNGSHRNFAPVAGLLDGLAASVYNPWRRVNPVNRWMPYDQYVDAVLDAAVELGVTRVAIWETGSPIDKSFADGSPNNGGTTDWAKRPDYMAGLLDYWYAGCVARGLESGPCIYWDNQSDPQIPNEFKHDDRGAGSLTAKAWHEWAPTLP